MIGSLLANKQPGHTPWDQANKLTRAAPLRVSSSSFHMLGCADFRCTLRKTIPSLASNQEGVGSMSFGRHTSP